MLALTLFLLFSKISLIFAGTGDTISHLEMAYGNLDLDNPLDKVNVQVLFGNVPKALEGTFIRHGCGVFGHSTQYQVPNKIDRIDHIFDCIEIAQAFHFHDGQVTFTSKFYDTIKNDIYR